MIGKLLILRNKKNGKLSMKYISNHIRGFIFLGHEIFGVGHFIKS